MTDFGEYSLFVNRNENRVVTSRHLKQHQKSTSRELLRANVPYKLSQPGVPCPSIGTGPAPGTSAIYPAQCCFSTKGHVSKFPQNHGIQTAPKNVQARL